MNAIEKIEKQIDVLKGKLKKAKQRQKLECLHCHKKTAIEQLTLVVMRYYVEPSGCSDGDYWTEGANPEFRVKCPHCNKESRYYYSEPLKFYKTSDVDELKNKWAIFVKENRSHFGNHTERELK